MIELTENQKHFIKCACNLDNHVIDFEMSDKEFKDVTGTTKAKMRIAINNLYKEVSY